MMKTIMVLKRIDLQLRERYRNIEDVNLSCFRGAISRHHIFTMHQIIFLDDNGFVKVLKNRYGREGVIKICENQD